MVVEDISFGANTSAACGGKVVAQGRFKTNGNQTERVWYRP